MGELQFNKRAVLALELTTVLLGATLCRQSLPVLLSSASSPTQSSEQRREVLYLPSGPALEFLSFGYRNTLADVLWFNTINYFGKHYASDQRYQWLYHMCDLVTTLDPRAVHVYEFGSTMLGWELGAPEQAIALLNKAIENNPDRWRLFYLRGFTYMFFMKEPERAHDDFVRASQFPDAHDIAARLAARTLVTNISPDEAISFLSDEIRSATDPNARAALEKRIREALYERDIRNLERAIQIYEQSNGRKPEKIEQLVETGIIKGLPRDPFGGTYYLEEQTLTVKSSSGRKRPTFFR